MLAWALAIFVAGCILNGSVATIIKLQLPDYQEAMMAQDAGEELTSNQKDVIEQIGPIVRDLRHFLLPLSL